MVLVECFGDGDVVVVVDGDADGDDGDNEDERSDAVVEVDDFVDSTNGCFVVLLVLSSFVRMCKDEEREEDCELVVDCSKLADNGGITVAVVDIDEEAVVVVVVV